MVALRKQLALILLLLPLGLCGQGFSVDDTLTEYPHKGTYYHNKFEGRKTANGEIFNQNLFTAAHWKIQMGTYVMVTNKNTGLQVIVRVNDRCPKHGVFDMSHRAANSIGINGCQPVTVRILPPSDAYIAQWQAQDEKFDSVYSKFGSQNPPPPKAKKTPRSDKTQAAPPPQKKPQDPKPKPQPALDLPPIATLKPENTCYRLELCTVESHSEAFSLIQKLPAHYQEKILVDNTHHPHIKLILDVGTAKKKADKLTRTLKPVFPHCKPIPCE